MPASHTRREERVVGDSGGKALVGCTRWLAVFSCLVERVRAAALHSPPAARSEHAMDAAT
jgi:hypothetical protein